MAVRTTWNGSGMSHFIDRVDFLGMLMGTVRKQERERESGCKNERVEEGRRVKKIDQLLFRASWRKKLTKTMSKLSRKKPG